jgi:hypothetical protein
MVFAVEHFPVDC